MNFKEKSIFIKKTYVSHVTHVVDHIHQYIFQ